MSFFVAEDRVHLRQGSGGFISHCGYEYPSIAVDWAGDYEPDAYDVCEECESEPSGLAPSAQEVVVVRGVYAVDDDAHLWVRRSEGAWHAVCGRDDANHTVAWADDEWPAGYDACSTCVELVDADLWQPDNNEDEWLPEPTDDERYRSYRVWVVQDGAEHRARNRELTAAMCGVELRAGVAPRLTQTSGTTHCHDCDRSVGRARAGLPVDQASPLPKGQPSKSQASKRKPPQPKRRTTSRTGKRSVTPARANGSRRLKSTDKEIALFGRKMIVPIRFVRGGAPGLGRRR